MRIAVNTRLLLANRLEGIGWFTHEILRRWVCAHPEHTFYFLFDREPDPAFRFAGNVEPVVLFPPARHPLLWYWFFEYSVSRFLRTREVDLFVSTDGGLPLHARRRDGRPIPCVDVIHDLGFEHMDGGMRRSHRWYYRHFFPRFARRADLLCTVSDFSRRDIAARYGVSAERVAVIYNAALASYHPIPEAEKEAVRAAVADGRPYFIYVGSIHRRKNVWRMLQAFDRFKAETGAPHRFVVVGTPMWRDRRMEKAYATLTYGDDILWPGRVEPDALNALVASAEALVYVSVFEGFGIPLVEAFAAETAVIASDVTSLPEVGGEAVCYVNPYDVASICEGMARVAGDAVYRAGLVARGRLQREKFSWDESSRRFDEAVTRLMDGR
ncbi:MAG: glycosyltransferase family 4 protein [Bacteroidales bacterium]|nr:glycosyltransferase family 4 protein [Bacteroidales bacterium]